MLERAVLTAEYSAILEAEFRVLADTGQPVMKLVGQVHATLGDAFAHTLCLMQLSNYFAPAVAKSQKRYQIQIENNNCFKNEEFDAVFA